MIFGLTKDNYIIRSNIGVDSLSVITYDTYTSHAALYKALDKNDWESAKLYLENNPGAVSARITEAGETALHKAASAGRLNLVKKLIELMPKEALEIKSDEGLTALLYTASEGSPEIAKLMVEKNSNVLRIRTAHNILPLVVSAICGHEDLTRYLYSVTPKEELDPNADGNGVTLLIATIRAELYDIALDLLQRYPQLATARDTEGASVIIELSRTPSAFPSGNRHGFFQQFIYTSIPVELRDVSSNQHNIQIGSQPNEQLFIEVPGVKQIYEKKVRHAQVHELLKVIISQISNLNIQRLKASGAYTAVIYTARYGIIEYFKELINSCPGLIHTVSNDKDGIVLFHEAVLARQHKIYNFISQMGVKNDLALRTSLTNNNMLHLAGFLAPMSQLERVSGAALQMQREIQWFLEVEQMVQPKLREMRNDQRKTPREVFREEHKALVKEGEAWLKETSQACMVVSTLIATVMFAAVFTLPGGNNQDTGTPILLKTRSFYIFIIADSLSLFASCTSILMFVALLTARYGERDFLKSLPRKLVLGLASLFISIATMMTAFAAALVMVLHDSVTWAYIPVTLLASIPVLLFGLLQFPLFVDIVRSTFGPGIFLKKKFRNKEE
ncbi:hypothetical protein MKW92_053215 [Papaver armeniacum]|nr:hypothetical protein MKW92_053215 [Papaver armeniacum]